MPWLSLMHWYTVLRSMERDIPGDLMVGASPSNAGDVGSIPDQGSDLAAATRQCMIRFLISLIGEIHRDKSFDAFYYNSQNLLIT